MSTIHKLRRAPGAKSLLGGLAMVALSVVTLSACGSLSVQSKKDVLASRASTRGTEEAIVPDSVPSVADGSVYWKQQNCAVCHADNGKGVPGKCSVDLTSIEWMRARKPVNQYMAIAFGEGKEEKTLVLTQKEKLTPAQQVDTVRTFKHPAYHDKLSRRKLWALVFYSRSLAEPLLSSAEHAEMKAVFGANCAVCHGTRGAGDGPLNKGLILQPSPANFTAFKRFYDRTDDQLFDHIAHGIKWEGMPNFLGKEDKSKSVDGKPVIFDEPFIWKLVQYVRNFQEDAEFALEKPKTASSDSDEQPQKPAAEQKEPAAGQSEPAAGQKEPAAGQKEGEAEQTSPAETKKPVEG